MFRTRPSVCLSSLFLSLALAGCGAGFDESTEDQTGDYEQSLLEEYRGAIPEAEQVEAPVPGPEADPNALTLLGNAELARIAANSAFTINLPAVLMVQVLRAITNLPPTMYDSKKKEFVWGPWDNDDGYGQVIAYIRENPEGDDFRYSYAFVRLVDSDLATNVPVIWGGATPGEEPRHGVGVTLWDFEANNAFAEEHDPDYDSEAPREEGRFAMVYGRGQEDDGGFSFNVAVFRNFKGKDAEPGAEAADLDYFYGQFRGDGNVVDFVDWSLDGNLCDADPETCFETAGTGAKETLDLRAAFFNRGMGRGEALISGGDLSQAVGVVECWDDDIDRTHMSVSNDGTIAGESGMCAPPFDSTLQELGVPTLADLDQEMLAKMDCVALNGFSACEGATE